MRNQKRVSQKERIMVALNLRGPMRTMDMATLIGTSGHTARNTAYDLQLLGFIEPVEPDSPLWKALRPASDLAKIDGQKMKPSCNVGYLGPAQNTLSRPVKHGLATKQIDIRRAQLASDVADWLAQGNSIVELEGYTDAAPVCRAQRAPGTGGVGVRG